jgi:hypothetical protein
MEDLNYLAEFHDHLKKAKIILAYDGVLSKDIVAAFLTRLKIDIEKTSVPKKEKKRFFSIVVECIQNLSKHGTVSELSDAHFLVLVEKENSTLKISTGNVVKNETQETIQALINNVNNKNKSELREMYKNGISKKRGNIYKEHKDYLECLPRIMLTENFEIKRIMLSSPQKLLMAKNILIFLLVT